eukprot:TRINITY_DN19796_c0_g1_i1.p1 TRINITY_DN19796_c0_g1~~TRINITY_DN19796_c0_g1_i1.p1  ORF type:complete len:531 (-),score=58.72 TRINITY_DN19796_c0_g1_i1:555-2114(-)
MDRETSDAWFDEVEKTDCVLCGLPIQESATCSVTKATHVTTRGENTNQTLSSYKKGLEQVSNIEQICGTRNQSYSDPSFPPSNESLGLDYEVTWLRASEIFAIAPGTPFLPELLDIDDVTQGSYPDCFFVAAVGSLLKQPKLLKNLFITQFASSWGVFAARFFQAGQWIPVVIDDWIPCKGKRPLFAHSKGGNAWISLLEKAYAKFYGCYAAINGGNISEALYDLTGLPVEDVTVSDTGGFWDKLQQEISKGSMLAVGTKQSLTQTAPGELQSGHAYSVVSLLRKTNEHIVTVHNPSSLSGRTTNLSLVNSEFSKHFQTLSIARPLPPLISHFMFSDSFSGLSAGGCNNFITWRNNPQFEILLENRAQLFITLAQPNQRMAIGGKKKEINYCQVGLTVVKATTLSPVVLLEKHEVIHRTTFWNKREISTTVDLGRGNYILIPSTFYPAQQTDFNLTIQSPQKIQSRKLDFSMYHRDTVAGNWQGQSAAGHQHLELNPNFEVVWAYCLLARLSNVMRMFQ